MPVSTKRAKKEGGNEGYWTSWILQDQTMVLFGCERVLFLKKGKNDLEGNSENIRAATPSSGPVGNAVSFCFRGRPLKTAMGAGPSWRAVGEMLPSHWVWKVGHQPKRIILQP